MILLYGVWLCGNILNLLLYYTCFTTRKYLREVFEIQTVSLLNCILQQFLFLSKHGNLSIAHWYLFDIFDILVRIAMFLALYKKDLFLRILGCCYLIVAAIKIYEYYKSDIGDFALANYLYNNRITLSLILTFYAIIVLSNYKKLKDKSMHTEEPAKESDPKPVTPHPLDEVPLPIKNPHPGIM